MRKAIRVLALALVLAAPAHAGIMQCPPPQPPPPQQATTVDEPTTDGEMHYPLVQLALSLLALL